MRIGPAVFTRSATAIAVLLAVLSAGHAMGGGGETMTGPAEDRVGLPRDYQTVFTYLRTASVENGTQNLIVYANAQAASVMDQANLPYPYGSVFLAEWRYAEGQPRAGELLQIDVMRRGAGFGEAYGEARSGEWEYVRYNPDGSHLIPPGSSGSCATCHQNAGEGRDFVFRGRF
jgi:hypothetical protein